jgi:D-amino peptidase
VIVDKRKETYTSGEESLKYLTDGRRRLREVAAAAVREASNMKPLIVPGPLHFEGIFRNEKLAKQFNTWGFKSNQRTVEWDANNMLEGMGELNKLTFFPKRIYPIRRHIFCPNAQPRRGNPGYRLKFLISSSI